MTNEHELGKW